MTCDLTVVETPDELAEVLREASVARRVGVDIESNGLFAYRARICMVQLVWESETCTRVAVVDGLTAGVEAMRAMLEAQTPIKVVHDVAFDARLLFKVGIALTSVHDTALCASFLGRSATGLGALLGTELGVQVDKSMQLSNWARRPLDSEALKYLAADVEHLLALDDRLWASALALGIDNEVRTEVDYRLRSAVQAEPTPPPSFVRIRGLDRLDDEGRAVLKEIAAEREHWAERMDVPPFKVATDQSLLMVAVRKPASTAELVAAVGSRAIHAQAAQAIVDGVRRGVAAGRLDPDHEALLRKPKMDRGVMEQRKKWEKRLTAWRKAESERRGVHAQVVLPGHCLRSLVSGELTTAAEIAGLDGMGEARGARYASVLAAMLGEGRSA